ncbi:haloacid dehalogenase-like hydrolase [Mycobacterium ostraviense]|uniref:haloacid dehalogenase-like hydrolase n=1 Tax=Mycobacterium ostraviense TaxID=2738409 RepID=UPI000A7747F3|nr:haloacid dehalogenase-like hydrolase [Mycobacterium ostraviense]UGT92029.1 haloacid dehalogenase-like hydrolase [Mycobacterium ostraviense]
MRLWPLRLLAAALAPVLALTGCSHAGRHSDAAAHNCRTLAADPGWHGDNRERIDAMINRLGSCGKAESATAGAPLVSFDWDNTMVRNDVGNATFYWMINNSKMRQPAGGNWSTTSAYLTTEAAAALAAACGGLADPGQPLPTGSNTGCADELVTVYTRHETRSGAAAFTGYNRRRIQPGDAWAAELLAGWTDAEITEFAAAARKQSLDAAEGSEQTVGSTRQTGWVRYYTQMRDLVGTLQANGFDVRIISASAEPVVRVWAGHIGIPGDHVMGVRTDHDGDVLTPRLALCGGEPSIPFNEGKRCRVNEQVSGVQGAAAFQQLPEQRRQVFAAGDSDGDVTFIADATTLRLVLNRNQIELMCRAYANADGKWMVNPTFINPLPMSPPYPCATQGFDEPDGGQAPLRQADGTVVPDQQDRVH